MGYAVIISVKYAGDAKHRCLQFEIMLTPVFLYDRQQLETRRWNKQAASAMYFRVGAERRVAYVPYTYSRASNIENNYVIRIV